MYTIICIGCGNRFTKKQKGRIPQFCDTCRKKLQDPYRKEK